MNLSDDEDLELSIGRVLRLGVKVSSACFAIGLGLTLASAGRELAPLLALIGLITLMATPVARVVMSTVSYVRRRDWLFVALTLIVLVQLAASVVAALVGATR
ncbi:MAG TPA: DUF1634 domain-containing protein [Vicinamibacterales bacterium]|jgi:uncharacterized membrane protein